MKAIYDLCSQAGIQLDTCQAWDRDMSGKTVSYLVSMTINGTEFWYIYLVDRDGKLLPDYTVESERARFERALTTLRDNDAKATN